MVYYVGQCPLCSEVLMWLELSDFTLLLLLSLTCQHKYWLTERRATLNTWKLEIRGLYEVCTQYIYRGETTLNHPVIFQCLVRVLWIFIKPFLGRISGSILIGLMQNLLEPIRGAPPMLIEINNLCCVYLKKQHTQLLGSFHRFSIRYQSLISLCVSEPSQLFAVSTFLPRRCLHVLSCQVETPFITV